MSEPRTYHLYQDEFHDKNGQPPKSINAKSRKDRAIDELVGICRGVLVDGLVTEKESHFLDMWTKANPEVATTFPGYELVSRLNRLLKNGTIDEAGRIELTSLLEKLTGQATGVSNSSTALPLDVPPPIVVFEARWFCLTGKFTSGSRSWCEEQIVNRGGNILRQVNGSLNYLVIGTESSRDWVHSVFGRKIEETMEIKKRRFAYNPVYIISEEHWARNLK